VTVGRADHHAVQLDGLRHVVLGWVGEADVLVPARDLKGILHAEHGFDVPVVAPSRCAVAAHLTVVAGDHQHQHALGQVREHGEEVQQQAPHDAKLQIRSLAPPSRGRTSTLLARGIGGMMSGDSGGSVR
jgi:hypothetical protein